MKLQFNWPDKLADGSKPVCPICGVLADGFTSAGEKDAIPGNDDLCVCLYCASVNQYKVSGGKTTVVALSDKEIMEIAKKEPKIFALIMDAVRAVKQPIIWE